MAVLVSIALEHFSAHALPDSLVKNAKQVRYLPLDVIQKILDKNYNYIN